MQTYTCPNGHKIKAGDRETVECQECELVATSLNRATGEVHSWMSRDDYDDSCENLQDQMDAAFDNQWFGD